MKHELSRRNFFRTAGAAGAAALPVAARGQTAEAPAHRAPAPGTAPSGTLPEEMFFFFTEPEAAFVRAAVDRLIPPDEEWPGAAWAGVVTYIDRQLAGAYGNGARLYLEGPWEVGLPQQGYQLRYTPAQLYRVAIEEIRRDVAGRFNGQEFWELEPDAQDGVLKALEEGRVELPSLPSAVFFETLLANTIEGFFADPVYGGNRDMVSWRMIGFPGAYAQYVDLVEEYGRPFGRPPMSIAESVLRHRRHG